MKQYFHQNIHKGYDYLEKFTASFEIPEYSFQDLAWKLLTKEDMVLRMGLSFCSPEDNFCKKTGRDIADKRLNKINFKISSMTNVGDKKLKVYCNNDEFTLELTYFKGKLYIESLSENISW